MFYSFVQKICAVFFAKFGIHMAVFSGGIVGRCFPLCTLTILYQQRGSHRRLGNAHDARDDLVEASCVSFASVQARKLNHYAASPLPTQPSGFAGSPRRASEKRTVGSRGRLHHAAQPNLFGHTTSGLHIRQAAAAGVASSRDPFHEL